MHIAIRFVKSSASLRRQFFFTSASGVKAFVFALFLTMAFMPTAAMAEGCAEFEDGIGSAICNVVRGSSLIPGLISAVTYMLGMFFGVMGVIKVKEHVIYPDRVTLWEPCKRFLAGGALFALPIVMDAAANTILGTTDTLPQYQQSAYAGEVSDGGLDAMLYWFALDLTRPMHILMNGFAYLAGMIFLVVGILRLLKSSQEGARGPGGFGTIMTFFIAGALFSHQNLMATFGITMFDSDTVANNAVLAYTGGMTAEEVAHVQAVISGVMGFIALVGWISFLRGWFIIREFAEGSQQASLMAGTTHIFAGALAVNLGPLLNAVQTTLGIDGWGVAFG